MTLGVLLALRGQNFFFRIIHFQQYIKILFVIQKELLLEFVDFMADLAPRAKLVPKAELVPSA